MKRSVSAITVGARPWGGAGGDLASAHDSLLSFSSGCFSGMQSHSTLIEDADFVPRTKICLIGSMSPAVETAANCFGLVVVRSQTGEEYLDDPSVVLVLRDFTSEVMSRFSNIKWRVLGSAAVVACAESEIPLPVVKRPLFCFTMKGVVTCVTGIRDKSLAKDLIFMVRSMGGSFREKPDSHTTHVISITTKGRTYNYARTFTLPVMTPEWVRRCWEHRHNAVLATDEQFMKYRLMPFVDVSAAFVGFPQWELDDMVRLLESHGGSLVNASSPQCTHIVCDDISPVCIPAGARAEVAVVRSEWFWSCIQQVIRLWEEDFAVPTGHFRRPPLRGSVCRRQNVWLPAPSAPSAPLAPSAPTGKENVAPVSPASPEPAKLVHKHKLRRLSLGCLRSLENRPVSDVYEESTLKSGSLMTPPSPVTRRQCGTPVNMTTPTNTPPLAVRCKSTASQSESPSLLLCPSMATPLSSQKRRGTPSTPGVRNLLSAGGCSPGRNEPGTSAYQSPRRLSVSRKGSLNRIIASPISPRYGAFLELLHTEENYVGILDAILQMRSEALNSTQAGGMLLSQTEAKMIFGTLMPIARTHHAILKDLRLILNNWTEAANIGEVYQKYCPELLRDYGPFVSSFKEAKETLLQCSERNPRFHAFLKMCRNKPECGRQELHELMIRPVQRLGSCKLLLREILKHTPEDCPDRKQLESALDSLSHVLSLINEDKRKMESLCKVFDVYHLVEKCPADVIASHRSLVTECEGVEISEHGFGKQGRHIAFFVFTDVIVVCKKKSKVVAMMKGQPGSNIPHRILKLVHGKPYKFIQMLPLSTIKKIVDVTNSDALSDVMGLVFRGKTETRESCSYFRLLEPSAGALDKARLIERWSVALANHNCVADPALFVQQETADEAGILSVAELLTKQINRAALMAKTTQVIVTSAFGLGRTLSAASKNSTMSPPRVLTTCYSASRLETVGEKLVDEEELEPKSTSVTAKLMKRM